MTNLIKIKQALDEGKAFFGNTPVLNPVLLKDYPSGKIPYVVLWREGEYYHYRHHGQSATKATKTDLSWIINKIFQLTPNQFVKKYDFK
jgi:hypothetical protein